MSDPFSLKGLRAVVTGAGRGLGRAIALAYANSGAELVLIARTAADLDAVADEIRSRDGRATCIPTDLRDSDAVRRAFDQIGELDILVNNAGTNIRKPVTEVTDEDWRTIQATNLDSAFFCAREAARRMIPRGAGRILNIGSVAGVVAIPTGVAYATTKAALGQMTRTLAQELGPHGITVNCIAPWYFRTPLTETLLADDAYRARILRATPLGRTGEDADLTGVATFFASAASSYVTGQTLCVDGGMSTAAFHPE